MSNFGEKWKTLEYQNHQFKYDYQISNLGRIRFHKTPDSDWIIKKFTKLQMYDYCGFMVLKGDKYKSVSVGIHRLVAINFLSIPDGAHKYVIHIDHDHRNNKANNLRWVDQKGLTAHNMNNPKVKASKDTIQKRIRRATLTETDVIRLKKRLQKSKNPLYKIAKEFGITHTQLNRIRSGENWGHVKIEDESS